LAWRFHASSVIPNVSATTDITAMKPIDVIVLAYVGGAAGDYAHRYV
jgi:hypothetical protein